MKKPKRTKKKAEDIIAPKQESAGMRLVARAIHGGWAIPAELMRTLPEEVRKIATDANYGERERLRAVELLASMERDNVAALVAADRIERLDGNRPTDLVRFEPITLRVGGGSEQSERGG